jgi:hypothetical protein
LAAAALDLRAEEPAVVVHDERPAVAELTHELRGALDIREDECDRAIREIGCQSLLQWDLGTNAGSRARWTVDRKLAS